MDMFFSTYSMKLSNKLNHKSRKKTKKKYGGGNESFYYGASNILSKYANIEPKNHISMNHGIPEIALSNVNLIEKFTGPIRKSFKNPIIASWCEDYLINGEVKDYCNKYTTENYSIEEKKLKKDQYYDYCNEKLKTASSKTYTNNDIIGHPVIYMDINFNKKPKYKNGLLVFYNHTYEKSTFGNNEEVLHKNYIKKLDKLKKKFHPIHICLYWKDFDNTNLTNLLKNNKYYYFTNGHRDNNDNFLDNLVNNIQNYNYITSSLIGTHTWVALYLKKYFFYMVMENLVLKNQK